MKQRLLSAIQNLSIRHKMTLLIMLICGIGLVASSLAFVIREAHGIRAAEKEDLASLAEIIGKNCAAALMFSDSKAARETLVALSAKSTIRAAYVLDGADRLFARYLSVAKGAGKFPLEMPAAPAPPHLSPAVLQKIRSEADSLPGLPGYFGITKPVVWDGQQVGTVVLLSDMSVFISHLRWTLVSTLVILAGSFLLIYWLSSRLQRLISDPVLFLSDTMKRVSREKDYSIRVVRQTDDELGELMSGFNAMLEHIELRDDQLEEVNRSLERRVAEAVAELRRKDQMLVQQNRQAAMGEMISNIAHQWRQPLNVVGGIVQNIQLSYESGHLDRESLEFEVREAMDAILYMSRTIDDFRNFFRPGKDKAVFSLNQVVATSLELVGASLRNSGIAIDLEQEGEVSAEGYDNEYSQVLLNIINNAKDALLAHGGDDPRIRIRVFGDNGHSVVTVRDNGGGIPDSILPKIFDPYFTTKEPGKGTGIGLCMSKVIIEQNMGGKLTACTVDGGAEFRIELISAVT
ncbi:HAMP domain-containing protein [Geobacter sp. FeAm09]|uniref:ATP-binding protein n=1 Tax=Geobacter sp. FeAm09 TaxID=2597769 RepID=UPI0011EBF160|nr:ATP-binding protein [Geobacter sp. FeAm09]QEM68718.1 HAMP domain-containing protein [Geobacter sp. FeAm09]